MSKSSKTKKAAPVEVDLVEEKPQPKVFVRPPKERRISFDQWAKIRQKPARHLGGMRAFLGPSRVNSKFTVEKWDEIFKAY